MWLHRKNLKKQVLSEFLNVQIFNRFEEMNSGASKNLLNSGNNKDKKAAVIVEEKK